MQADLFKDFPDLRLIIPHGGGAVPYHWGRFRGLADMLGRPPLEESVMGNVFFDTCVYHQPGIDLLFNVIDVGNILFGSEMIGAVRGIDPQTGHHFDDTRRYVDALEPGTRRPGPGLRAQRPPGLPSPGAGCSARAVTPWRHRVRLPRAPDPTTPMDHRGGGFVGIGDRRDLRRPDCYTT